MSETLQIDVLTLFKTGDGLDTILNCPYYSILKVPIFCFEVLLHASKVQKHFNFFVICIAHHLFSHSLKQLNKGFGLSKFLIFRPSALIGQMAESVVIGVYRKQIAYYHI